ncbi:hypothetical protein PVAND_008206 [Polypedilum vanderplanki]|uniref:Uncharacterized protein n=1 Tax=Polypedilum vanderplanki TaxID=319348 RepID=A0A9J6C9U5_POLVA|nr:hypothetical protein PVAND_008206 [Polypedilum vanderplanki]
MLQKFITFLNFFLLLIVIVWSLSISNGIDNEKVLEDQRSLISEDDDPRNCFNITIINNGTRRRIGYDTFGLFPVRHKRRKG